VISAFKNRKVLVTGGLGFIGSNLALRLVRAGARVAIVDSEVAGCGANRHNIAAAAADLQVIVADVGDAASFAREIRGCSAIFNLAGEVSHIHSMRDPGRDAALNAMSQLRFLKSARARSRASGWSTPARARSTELPNIYRWTNGTLSSRWISTASTNTPPRPTTFSGAAWGGSTPGCSV
jgi:NAD(P)-dependent dehydrogenase (short-subunit alcohol dehydrogenase family)